LSDSSLEACNCRACVIWPGLGFTQGRQSFSWGWLLKKEKKLCNTADPWSKNPRAPKQDAGQSSQQKKMGKKVCIHRFTDITHITRNQGGHMPWHDGVPVWDCDNSQDPIEPWTLTLNWSWSSAPQGVRAKSECRVPAWVWKAVPWCTQSPLLVLDI
jgi:hypothetical protein